MTSFVQTINAFIEDTCVIIVVAYLLARGPMLSLLFDARRPLRKSLSLGIVLGLVGVTEAVFPGARYPYVTNTLITTFAALTGGLAVGLITALIASAGALIVEKPFGVLETGLSVFVSAGIGELVRRSGRQHHALAGACVAGMLAQTLAFMLHSTLYGPFVSQAALGHALMAIPSNGFGVTLLQLVAHDARIRSESERNRTDAEHARALVAQAQLMALRARVHPHYLYNALTSIASLCGIDSQRAEAATIRLGQLMRRTLEARGEPTQPLSEELEALKDYLEIEQYRFGERLTIRWSIDPVALPVRVPPFCLQTLVENAINHGVAPKMGARTVRVICNSSRRHLLVAVCDNGAGMTPQTRRSALEQTANPPHGLSILNQQLTLLFGRRARVRLLTRPDEGTCAFFAISDSGDGLSARTSTP